MTRFILVALASLGLFLSISSHAFAADSITVDPTKKIQTFTGWEAADYIGERGYPPYNNLSKYKNILLDKVVNEYGLNRIRLEVRPAIEYSKDLFQDYINNPTSTGQRQWVHTDSMKFINDNNDPNVIDPKGFFFTSLDDKIEESVLELRRLLNAKGEKLIINLTYVGFGTSGGLLQYNDPKEYAEYMLAIFQHMQQKYGFVPDLIEIELEPDNNTMNYSFSAKEMGEALVKTREKLGAYGFNPKYIIPNTTNLDNVMPNVTTITDVICGNYFFEHWPSQCRNGTSLSSIIQEIGYHRYQPPNPLETIKTIGNTAYAAGIGAAMLEWWDTNNTYSTLYSDLTDGKNTAWQQDAILSIYNVSSDGSTVAIADKSKYIRQFTYFIRPGAIRIDATTTNTNRSPVAFINKDNKYVVVVKMQTQSTSTPFSVSGLPAGTYGITHTLSTTNWNQALPDQSITAGSNINLTLNGTGVVTIYQKNSQVQNTPTPTQNPTSSPTPMPTSVPSSTPTTTTSSPTPTITNLPIGNGDVNNDGKQDINDVLTLLQNWFMKSTTNGSGIDQYGDGWVNAMDFAVVASKIPSTTPSITPSNTVTATSTPTPETQKTIKVGKIVYESHTSDMYASELIVDATNGNAIGGATVSQTITNTTTGQSWNFTSKSISDGWVWGTVINAPAGCYSTKINEISMSGYVFDGVTPNNQYCK